MSRHSEQTTVPVAGGAMTVGVWEPAGTAAGTLVCVHGITSTHRAFDWLAQALPQWRLVAPDLRGRGGSAGLGPPYGMAAHAEDVAALLDHLGVGQAVVLGHSMGGFVAVVLAHRHPDRVGRLVLVDGGLPIPTPPGLDQDELLQAVIGPAAERLAMRFGSVEEHREFWRKHPAFAEDWGPGVQAYVDYDLVGQAPQLRSSAEYAGVRDDSTDLHTGDAFTSALGALAHPATFLRAERGMLDQPEGLYPEAVVDQAVAEHPALSARTLPGVNHYTVLMSDRGAAAVAEAVGAGSAR